MKSFDLVFKTRSEWFFVYFYIFFYQNSTRTTTNRLCKLALLVEHVNLMMQNLNKNLLW